VIFLLDVNVLIALIDPAHEFHLDVHDWFFGMGPRQWATCPMTENSVLRIVGHSSYRNTPGGPSIVSEALLNLRGLSGHHFWPDSISIVDRNYLDTRLLASASQVTDSYLLALAIAHGGQLATLDRRLIPDAVRNGVQGLHLIQ
jgi:toxin-antitoxin system PIN domain toxin